MHHTALISQSLKDCVLVSTYAPLLPECQPCFIPDVLFSAAQVPFVLHGSGPSAAVGLRFDVVHSLSEMKSAAYSFMGTVQV